MYITYEDLVKKIENEDKKKYDINLIEKAYQMAKKAHEGQFRSSGEEYFTHPITVAGILVEIGMDTESVIAAILHDVAEDTEITIDEIKKEFTENVAMLVDGVTKLGQIPFSTKEERQAENVRKMLLAMTKDIRVVIIKLCDRLHNMRTLSARPAHKQIAKSKETMEVYAPIAHRLGMTSIKEELEDISIQYLDPYGYKDIEDFLSIHKEDREKIVDNIVEKLKVLMKDNNKNAYIYGRVKSIYGIYRKTFLDGKEFDDIYDIYAVRIMVDSINECYNVLGIMHDFFTPIPNKFKDYISLPKQNGYQSLHTAVLSKSGVNIEIQIRTLDMHHSAEYGVAAHWKYKEGVSKKDKLEERVSWVRRLLEEQTDSSDSTDILTTIKSDIAPEDVFVFTPHGDVKSLPVGSTVIDFAYEIHSDIGNNMTGAKVNGKLVPLDYEVSTGEIIEILTSKNKNHGPSRDWLKIVKTGEARNKIKTWYKKEKRQENVSMGKADLDKEFKRNLVHIDGEEKEEFILALVKRQKYDTLEDFYASIGYGGVQLSKIMQRVKDEYLKLVRSKKEDKTSLNLQTTDTKSKSGIYIEGVDNCLVKFSKCCTPLPGDDIIGFITRGYGVSIHKIDCVNVNIEDEKYMGRWVNASWSEPADISYKSTIAISVSNSNGLIADIGVLLSNMRIPIYELSARDLNSGYGEIIITLGIKNVEHLYTIIQKIKKVKSVEQVRRIGL
ncbi:MAG: RelA/SpoT family protein [Oscillospiraceae bacterium]